MYAVIPAHSLFSAEANDRFQRDPTAAGRIRYFFENDDASTEVSIQYPSFKMSNTGSPDVYLHSAENLMFSSESAQFPIGYRYKCRFGDYKEDEFSRFCANDVALLPFSSHKRSEAEAMQKSLNSYNMARVDELKETSIEDLQQYHRSGTPIMVKGYKGKLDPTVDVRQLQHDGFGLFITFLLETR